MVDLPPAPPAVEAPSWRAAAAPRCPFGACYLYGASLPCVPDCWHCRRAAAHGCRDARCAELRPCPRCGHLPEQVEDPGPLPRLNERRPDATCAFCEGPVEGPQRKYCSDVCWNAFRRVASDDDSEETGWFKGAVREPAMRRVSSARSPN